MQVTLRYDPSFAKPNTWMLAPDGGGVRARVKMGGANEIVLDLLLYTRTKRKEALHARRLDETTWRVESSTHGGLLPRVEVVLIGANEYAATSLEML